MGEGQGGRPLAKSRRQTNCGSNGRPLCSCAFRIGNSKRLRFIRTHTRRRANSRRMMARGGCPDDRSYCPKRRRASCFSWRMDTIPQNEEPPGARKRRRHLHVCSQCSRPTCGRTWPRGCVPVVVRLEVPRLGRAQRLFHVKANQQRLLPRRTITSAFASDARAWACADGGQADVHAQ
jgi:hypothetical protein